MGLFSKKEQPEKMAISNKNNLLKMLLTWMSNYMLNKTLHNPTHLNSTISKDITCSLFLKILRMSEHPWLHPIKLILLSNCTLHRCLIIWNNQYIDWLKPFQKYWQLIILETFRDARTCLTSPNKNYMMKL